jgi:hypothetical protein
MHRHPGIPVAGAMLPIFPAAARNVGSKHSKEALFLSKEIVC